MTFSIDNPGGCKNPPSENMFGKTLRLTRVKRKTSALVLPCSKKVEYIHISIFEQSDYFSWNVYTSFLNCQCYTLNKSVINQELEFCSSQLTRSLYSQNKQRGLHCYDEIFFWWSEISFVKKVSFWLSETSVDGKCPFGGQKSALLEMSFWGSEISVVEKYPSVDQNRYANEV